LRPVEDVVLPQISETEIARVQDMCSKIVICIQLLHYWVILILIRHMDIGIE